MLELGYFTNIYYELLGSLIIMGIFIVLLGGLNIAYILSNKHYGNVVLPSKSARQSPKALYTHNTKEGDHDKS